MCIQIPERNCWHSGCMVIAHFHLLQIFHIATVSIVHTSVCVCVCVCVLGYPHLMVLPTRPFSQKRTLKRGVSVFHPSLGSQQGHWRLLFLHMLFKTLIGMRHGKGCLWQTTWVKKKKPKEKCPNDVLHQPTPFSHLEADTPPPPPPHTHKKIWSFIENICIFKCCFLLKLFSDSFYVLETTGIYYIPLIKANNQSAHMGCNQSHHSPLRFLGGMYSKCNR